MVSGDTRADRETTTDETIGSGTASNCRCFLTYQEFSLCQIGAEIHPADEDVMHVGELGGDAYEMTWGEFKKHARKVTK